MNQETETALEVLYRTITVLPTDFTGCQRLWSVGPAELETGCTQSETFARSYTVTDETTGLGTKNEKAAQVRGVIRGKPSEKRRPWGVCLNKEK